MQASASDKERRLSLHKLDGLLLSTVCFKSTRPQAGCAEIASREWRGLLLRNAGYQTKGRGAGGREGEGKVEDCGKLARGWL